MNAERAAGVCLSLLALAACGEAARWRAERVAVGAQALSSANVRWERREVSLPPARMAHALLYDSVRELTIAAGGRPVSDIGDSRSDTWSWDGESWEPLSVSFAPRGFLQGTFDSQRGVAVAYGGLEQFPGSSYFAETWEREAGSWSNRGGTPGARSTAGLSFDSGRGVSVLFGGYDGAWLGDLWEWDGSTWTRRCNDAPCSIAARPARRAAMGLAYDAARAQTLLFGGFDSTAGDLYYGDTWTWDGSAWTEHPSAPAPSARTSAAMAYDPVTRRVYLFGGKNGAAELRDLWAWDGSGWELIDDAAPPSARRDARLVWDTARRRGVLFGGRASSQAVDFWELSLVGNECASAADCHTGYCDGSVCADAPAGEPPEAGSAGASATEGGAASGGTAGAGAAAAAATSSGGASGAPWGGGLDAGLDGAGELRAGDASVQALAAGDAKSLYACALAARPPPARALGSIAALGLLGAAFGRRAFRRRRRCA